CVVGGRGEVLCGEFRGGGRGSCSGRITINRVHCPSPIPHCALPRREVFLKSSFLRGNAQCAMRNGQWNPISVGGYRGSLLVCCRFSRYRFSSLRIFPSPIPHCAFPRSAGVKKVLL